MQDLAREYCQEGWFWGKMGGNFVKGTKMKQMKHWILGVLLAVMLAGGALAGDFDKGLKSFLNKEYVIAIDKLIPLAESGNAQAQYYLGVMHENGEGVSQDYAKASEWYRRAAEAGYLPAKFKLPVQ